MDLIPVTSESIAAAKAAQARDRRDAAREIDMLTVDRLVHEWGADQVQRWLDGAVAIRQDARRV